MNLRDEEGLFFCWKVVDTRRREGDRWRVRIVPDPAGFIENDRFDVTAITIERE